jgi:hypothetical protein
MCKSIVASFFLALIIVLPIGQGLAAYLLDTIIKKANNFFSHHVLRNEWDNISYGKSFDWLLNRIRWKKLEFLENNLSILPIEIKKIMVCRKIVFRITLMVFVLLLVTAMTSPLLSEILC